MTTLHLTAPLEIGPRLLPSVSFEGGRVSLDPDTYEYFIDLDDGTEVHGDDFSPPRVAPMPRDVPASPHHTPEDEYVRMAMGSLLGFLSAFAEARNPRWGGPSSECYDLFPDEIGEWAYLNDDEITMAAHELESGE